MKTTSPKSRDLHRRSRSRTAIQFWALGWLGGLMLGAGSFTAQAVLPEPDNVIYGVVARGGVPVTAADYDVIIQVRREPAGPAIATYQMGSNARLGDIYSVRVPMESVAPKVDPGAAQTSDLLYLVASDYNGDFATTNLVVGQRGAFQRIDLGAAASPDADGDGLPDAWEIAKFGNLSQDGNGDPDGDGRTTREEFLAGTHPNNPDDVFRLYIASSDPSPVVQFFARKAEGTGYEGYNRIYALEYTTNLASGTWVGVPGRTNILGDNTTVTYPTTPSAPEAYYRTRLSLQAP